MTTPIDLSFSETPENEPSDVTVEGEPAPQEPFIYDEDAKADAGNLVHQFEAHPDGKEALLTIADRVVTDYEADREASEPRREQFRKDWAIFAGNLPKKTYPFKNSANPHIPIAFENTTRNVGRAESELFGDWDDVFGVSPIGPGDEEMAGVLTLHGNWQIRQQIPDFRRQMARAMLLFFFHGDVSGHSYYDTELGQNRHEVLSLDEFAVPYVYTSTMPDYSDVPHRTKVLSLYRHSLKARKDQWANVDEVIERAVPELDEDRTLAQAVSKSHGVEPEVAASMTPPNEPYKLLWYEGWLELPNQENDRFCRAVVDPETKSVLELIILEQPDWQDVQRYESQEQELQSFRTEMSFYEQHQTESAAIIQSLEQQAQSAASEMGPQQVEQVRRSLDAAKQMQQRLPPPTPPTWVKNPSDPNERPERPKKRPVHMFTHGVLIEPIVGGIGMGYGSMQCDFNRVANTAYSQFTDAATFANCGGWIVSDLVEFVDPKQEVYPGVFIRVSGITGEELQNSIIPLKFQPANPQLVELADKQYQYAQSAMQAPSVLSGDPGKSGETFRGLNARIEQATKQLSGYTRKFSDGFLIQILRDNAALNAIYLREEEFFQVAVAGGIPVERAVGRRMYERNYHVEIRSDLRFLTQSQRVQEADELYGIAMKTPQLQQNQAFMYAVVKKMLEARRQRDMIQLLGAPPPPPPTFGPPPPPPTPPGAGAAPGGPPPPGARPMGPPPAAQPGPPRPMGQLA